MEIVTGIIAEPHRVAVYGGPGIGKSTFAAGAPSPFFITCEEGSNQLPVARPKSPPRTFAAVDDCLRYLYEGDHDFRTVVVDSLDALEPMIWAEVCREHRVETIADIDFGKGYHKALKYWRRFTTALDTVRITRGMHVVLICHAAAERFEDPETAGYDRYTLKLHKLAAAHVIEWCDEVLYAAREIHTRDTDGKYGKKVPKAIGGRRVLRTEARPAAVAKNRLGLPPELELSWQAFAEYLPAF